MTITTIGKDASIVTQVAAKIAGDLTRTDQPLEHVLSDFSTAFQYVKNELFQAHAIDDVADAFPGTTYAPQPQQTDLIREMQRVVPQPQQQSYVTPDPVGPLQIAGNAHGTIPDWLVKDAARAGVGRVWDNRDKATTENKRPWFKQADAQNGADPIAFWPPRSR